MGGVSCGDRRETRCHDGSGRRRGPGPQLTSAASSASRSAAATSWCTRDGDSPSAAARVRIETPRPEPGTSAHVRSRPACPSRHAARDTRARTRRSRRPSSIRSPIVTRPTLPAAFRKLDAVAVLTDPLLPVLPATTVEVVAPGGFEAFFEDLAQAAATGDAGRVRQRRAELVARHRRGYLTDLVPALNAKYGLKMIGEQRSRHAPRGAGPGCRLNDSSCTLNADITDSHDLAGDEL